MPLAQYGVLLGGLFTPQEQTYQGDWFHGIFYLTVPWAEYPLRCVTDFSSATKDLIEYRIFPNLDPNLLSNILALSDGYTALASTPISGAIDYVRSPLFGLDGWIVSDGKVAVQALQDTLSSNPQKLFVFGEPFVDRTPVTEVGIVSKDGMHNVHMNQPDGRDHQADDGIWQDGCTIFLHADDTLSAFCSKFVSQTFSTNDRGLPA